MAASPWQLHQIAENSDFQRRVKYYMQKGAVAVLSEALVTAGHTERVAYATTAVNGSALAFEHAIAGLTNATLVTNADFNAPVSGAFGISDSDLEFAVNEMWNAMSGFSSGA